MTHAFSSAYSEAFDVDQQVGHGSWDKLLDILRQDVQEREDWERSSPIACPIDGTPLETGPGGALHCPMGNYTRSAGWTNELG
jgi:hypothetical protein